MRPSPLDLSFLKTPGLMVGSIDSTTEVEVKNLAMGAPLKIRSNEKHTFVEKGPVIINYFEIESNIGINVLGQNFNILVSIRTLMFMPESKGVQNLN